MRGPLSRPSRWFVDPYSDSGRGVDRPPRGQPDDHCHHWIERRRIECRYRRRRPERGTRRFGAPRSRYTAAGTRREVRQYAGRRFGRRSPRPGPRVVPDLRCRERRAVPRIVRRSLILIEIPRHRRVSGAATCRCPARTRRRTATCVRTPRLVAIAAAVTARRLGPAGRGPFSTNDHRRTRGPILLEDPRADPPVGRGLGRPRAAPHAELRKG